MPSAVEKISHCRYTKTTLCHINPIMGRNCEILVKRSLESSMIRQHLSGTIHLNDSAQKRLHPDIYMDVTSPGYAAHIGMDVKRWTRTEPRGGKVYESRECYGSQRAESSIATYLQDSSRFLYVAFELAIIDSQGNRERRLFCVPGAWLKSEFDQRTGVDIEDIASAAWPGFAKGRDLLYQIDVCGLIEAANYHQGGRRS